VERDLEQFYKSFSLKPGGVIHAGASTCQERDDYDRTLFLPVYWIEALEDVAEQAKLTLKNYKSQQIVRATLWSSTGKKLKFRRASNSVSSSLLKMKLHNAFHPQVSEGEPEEHVTSTLDDIFLTLPSSFEPTLLVLDLQGAELHALRGARNLLKKVSCVVTEVSLVEMYKGQPKFPEICEFLKINGFALVQHNLFDNNVMGDAFFLSEAIVRSNSFSVLVPPRRERSNYLRLMWVKAILVRAGMKKRNQC
jgi:FkbM family methyltransferase